MPCPGIPARGVPGSIASKRRRATAAPALQVYGLSLQHKHVPEIQHHGGLSERPFFVPAYGSFRQGIVLTVPLHQRLLPTGTTTARVLEALQAHFAGAAHVQVTAAAQAAAMSGLDPQALNGRDDLRLTVFGNDRQGQLLLAAVFDNLGKGAAGAAVQNLDLLLQAG
jgi:N-acetyl-gamma-glutamyl-phosphate reductase